MGVKQSKRSVDITEISTKGEIEGFGNEGKVEKIIDGVVEKVAANGHVDGELQNGVEAHQNGLEAMQNGEAAAVATEKVTEKKDLNDSPGEGVVNGQMENGEVHVEPEKTDESKKSEEKKDKRKEKKEKIVKKKFSFRNFSFSKKDKSKPPKEEKSPEKVDEAGAEEPPASPEKQEMASPSQGELLETPEPAKQESDSTMPELTTTPSEQLKQEFETPPLDVTSKTSAQLEDLPPPLPASPPPTDPPTTLTTQLPADNDTLDVSPEQTNDSTLTVSNPSPPQLDAPTEPIQDPEQIVFQAGKQIEEKATNLLKAVEERAEETMRTAGDVPSQMAHGETVPDNEEVHDKMPEDPVPTIPIDISNLGSLTSKAEEASDKAEEGAGESLAEVPKDLSEEVTAATIEASNPDSLEIVATAPPPVVEAVTGE